LLKEQFGSEMDNVELEEIFAEGLIKWVNATDKQKAQMNFSDRVKAWFDKIIESMRKLFTNEDSVWNSVNDFYADLYSGKLKEQSGITEDIKTMFREVWHGSPHAIDKFMTKFMGTGEGAQAFGWGLYFTDVKDVGEWYAKSFFRTKQLSDKIKSKILKGITVENWTSKGEDIDLEYALWSELGDMKHEWTNDEVFDLAVTIAVSGRSHREITEVTHKALIKNKKKLEQYLEKNYLYKTNIWKNGNEDLLDWHGDVTKEQLNKIDKYTNERIKRKMYEQSLNLSGEKKPLSGSSLYRAIALALGTEREASLFLLRAGIDGIKYPAGTLSGSAKEGQYNYVVFDEKAIEILDKIQYRMRQNADIRYREVDDKMTQKNRRELYKIVGKLNQEHYFLSGFAKQALGVTSTKEITKEQFKFLKEQLNELVGLYNNEVEKFEEAKLTPEQQHRANEAVYSSRTGKDLAQIEGIGSIAENTQVINDIINDIDIYEEEAIKLREKLGGKLSLEGARYLYLKLNSNFHDSMAKFSHVSGNERIEELAKETVHGAITTNGIMNEYLADFHHKFRTVINMITVDDWQDIISYLNTGEMPARIVDNELINQMIDFLEPMRERAMGLVRKQRVEALFDTTKIKPSRRSEYYTKEQIAWGEEKRVQYLNDYAENNQTYKDFLQRVQDGTEEGSEMFVIKNYLMKDKAEQEGLNPLWHESLFNKIKLTKVTGLNDLMKREGDLGAMQENPVEKIFFSLKRALRKELMGDSIDNLSAELDNLLEARDYDLYKDQLKSIIGQSYPPTISGDAYGLLLSRNFKIQATKLKMQPKNIYQPMFMAETPAEYWTVLTRHWTNVLTGKSDGELLAKEFGEPVRQRFYEEASNKHISTELGGNKYANKIEEFKKWSNIAKGKSNKRAWLVSHILYNRIAQLWDKSLADRAVVLQQLLDLENRYLTALIVLRRAKKLFANDKVTWDKIYDKMSLSLLEKADQQFLRKILVKQGTSEFAIQTALLHALRTQFEYNPKLKPIITQSAKNVPVIGAVVKGALMYRIWGSGFQEMIRKDASALFSKGKGKKAAIRNLISVFGVNILGQILFMSLVNSLPKKDDDDDYLDRVKNGAISTFLPSSYGGIYNTSLLIPVVGNYLNPFQVKDILSGMVSYKSVPYEIFEGQAGGQLALITNIFKNVFAYYITDDKKIKDKALILMLNDGDRLFKQHHMTYMIAERIMTLAYGGKRLNLLRQMEKVFGISRDYNYAKEDRNLVEALQWLIFETNAPYVGDNKAKPVYVPSTPSRSGGRPKGNRSGSRF